MSMSPLVLLSIFLASVAQEVWIAAGESRVSRSDVREVLRGQIDPSFWPTRGRRGGSSEEKEPPFWANRGRSESNEEQPPFWGNRGREVETTPLRHPTVDFADVVRWANTRKRQSINSCCDRISAKYPMLVEEPQYLLLNRRGAGEDDHYWVSRGRREAITKRELARLSQEFSPFDDDGSAAKNPSSDSKFDSKSGHDSIARGNSNDTKFWKTLASKIQDKQLAALAKSTTENSSDK